jgi:hypothetical protein
VKLYICAFVSVLQFSVCPKETKTIETKGKNLMTTKVKERQKGTKK